MRNYTFIHPDPTLQNNLMAFGFECQEGWYPLIEEYFDKIQDLLDSGTDEQSELFEVVQVKEKWGELCTYHWGGNQAIEDLLDELKDACDNTCETCGKSPAKVFENHLWLKTLCEDCGKIYLTK